MLKLTTKVHYLRYCRNYYSARYPVVAGKQEDFKNHTNNQRYTNMKKLLNSFFENAFVARQGH
jgi:hypothetical protein